jgi:nucleotide-binding universal stress UspA family protein
MLRIFHPTDLSHASEVAFAHAMKLGLASRGELTIFHMARERDAEDDLRGLPHVRETLIGWGLLPPHSPREAVGGLGVRVTKIEVLGDDPTDAVLTYLESHAADLVVLATHQRDGIARWLHREVAAPLFQRSSVPALFVPPGVDGFVDLETGQLRLRRILFPIDEHPHPDSALRKLPGIIGALRAGPVTVELLHVGASATVPKLQVPEIEGWTWTTRVVDGHVVEAILSAANTQSADLLVMTTHGKHGFLDALRGSTTEHVVRRARCPVLAVPALAADIGVVVSDS